MCGARHVHHQAARTMQAIHVVGVGAVSPIGPCARRVARAVCSHDGSGIRYVSHDAIAICG